MDDLLPLIRKQIRSDREDEDDYLKHLLNAGITRFETFTGHTLKPSDYDISKLTTDEIPLTTDILHGLLLLIGQWYEYRENVVDSNLSAMPEATERLWEPYIIYHLGDV